MKKHNNSTSEALEKMDEIIKIGKQYRTRSGIITPPIEAYRSGGNYRFGAWIKEKEYPSLSFRSWLSNGSFLSMDTEHRLDLIEEHI